MITSLSWSRLTIITFTLKFRWLYLKWFEVSEDTLIGLDFIHGVMEKV